LRIGIIADSELAFRTVRQGRAAAGVIVGGQRQHATQARGASGVAVLEHVAAAIHARALAVPHRKHAIDGGAFEQVGLLRAPDHGCAKVFIEARGELHAGGLQVLLRAPQFQIETAQ
jgi:phosphatidylserine/phosphatidylglycerophosphate/cardiolipin synthase-like enzyme